jgi:putative endonuclease
MYGKWGKHWGKQYQHFDTFICTQIHLKKLETLVNKAIERNREKSEEIKLVPSGPRKPCFMEFVVYILQSKSNQSFYVGYTSFLILRIREHNSGMSKHTSKHIPWEVVYVEFFNSKTEAIKREKSIKKMKSRNYIEELVKKHSS